MSIYLHKIFKLYNLCLSDRIYAIYLFSVNNLKTHSYVEQFTFSLHLKSFYSTIHSCTTTSKICHLHLNRLKPTFRQIKHTRIITPFYPATSAISRRPNLLISSGQITQHLPALPPKPATRLRVSELSPARAAFFRASARLLGRPPSAALPDRYASGVPEEPGAVLGNSGASRPPGLAARLLSNPRVCIRMDCEEPIWIAAAARARGGACKLLYLLRQEFRGGGGLFLPGWRLRLLRGSCVVLIDTFPSFEVCFALLREARERVSSLEFFRG